MKTLVTVVASALLSWSASAVALAAPPANVNFSLERGQVFGLALDGRALTRPLARQVHVERLIPGQHWADFSVPTPYGPPMRIHTAVWLQPGLETSYVLVLRPGYGPQLRQVAAVPVYGSAPGYGGAYPRPLPPQPGYPYGNGQGGYYGGSPNGSYNAPSPAPAPYGGNQGQGGYGNQAPAPYGGNQGQGGYDNRQAPAPAYPGGYGNSPAPTPRYPGGYQQGNAQPNGANLQSLPPRDVQRLTQDLRNRPSDEERLDLAKQALADNSVRADELAQFIATLEYDKARIDLAEFGYAHVSDPQNFTKVYDVLHYPDSIQEVQQALGLDQRN